MLGEWNLIDTVKTFLNKRKLKGFAKYAACILESKLSNLVYWGLLVPKLGIYALLGIPLKNP